MFKCHIVLDEKVRMERVIRLSDRRRKGLMVYISGKDCVLNDKMVEREMKD